MASNGLSIITGLLLSQKSLLELIKFSPEFLPEGGNSWSRVHTDRRGHTPIRGFRGVLGDRSEKAHPPDKIQPKRIAKCKTNLQAGGGSACCVHKLNLTFKTPWRLFTWSYTYCSWHCHPTLPTAGGTVHSPGVDTQGHSAVSTGKADSTPIPSSDCPREKVQGRQF